MIKLNKKTLFYSDAVILKLLSYKFYHPGILLKSLTYVMILKIKNILTYEKFYLTKFQVNDKFQTYQFYLN